jgi:type III secretion system YscQ/HrcQ family protein
VTSAHELASRLPQVREAQAYAGARLLASLARAGLRARVTAPTAPDEARWRIGLRSDFGPLALEPIRGSGRSLVIASRDGFPDLVAAGEALDASEALIGAIESALDTPLWPLCLQGDGDPSSAQTVLDVQVEAPGDDCARLRVSTDVLERMPSPRWAEPPQALLELRVPCQIRIGGCTVGADRLAVLGPGDLLLDTTQNAPLWSVQVGVNNTPPFTGTLHPATRELTLDTKERSAMDTARPEGDHDSTPRDDSTPGHGSTPGEDTPTWTDIPMVLRFELPGITLPLAAIAGLQPGSVMKIAAADAALRVEVLAGDKSLGHGELVAVGDSFGVRLLERLIAVA